MKPYTLAVVALTIVLAGATYTLSQRSQNNDANRIPTTEITPTIKDITTDNPEQTDSRYVTYSKTAFDGARNKKRVLFFHAPWCPTCKPADVAFEKDATRIPENVILFKTDYDTSSDLKKKYGVTYQHTFVQVDASGNEVTKWNGGQLTELTANVK